MKYYNSDFETNLARIYIDNDNNDFIEVNLKANSKDKSFEIELKNEEDDEKLYNVRLKFDINVDNKIKFKKCFIDGKDILTGNLRGYYSEKEEL
jgi:hypothetical protein